VLFVADESDRAVVPLIAQGLGGLGTCQACADDDEPTCCHGAALLADRGPFHQQSLVLFAVRVKTQG
jgi:hypothetical protein